MSAERVWASLDGSAVYDDRTSLGYSRHHRGGEGRYVVFYSGGFEAAEFMGTKLEVVAVADDFGNLVQVPA
jgi:hypothetical protein